MYALITTKRNQTGVSVQLFQSRAELEREMIVEYNNYLKKAKEVDWRYTFFDNEKWYGSVDDWVDRVELRYCEVA